MAIVCVLFVHLSLPALRCGLIRLDCQISVTAGSYMQIYIPVLHLCECHFSSHPLYSVTLKVQHSMYVCVWLFYSSIHYAAWDGLMCHYTVVVTPVECRQLLIFWSTLQVKHAGLQTTSDHVYTPRTRSPFKYCVTIHSTATEEKNTFVDSPKSCRVNRAYSCILISEQRWILQQALLCNRAYLGTAVVPLKDERFFFFKWDLNE